MSNLQITCPQCGVFNDITEAQCWRCKRPISDEEKQRTISSLPEVERIAYVEKQTRSSSPQDNREDTLSDNVDYRTSILVAKIVSAVGWITCVAAVVIVIATLAVGGAMGALAIVPGLGVFIGGLILVVAGQASRAAMDSANYSRLMLEEMRKKA